MWRRRTLYPRRIAGLLAASVRGHRFLLVAGALVLVAVASPEVTRGANGQASGCHPRGSKTLLANGVARVFRLRHTVYACRYKGGRRVSLGVVSGLGGEIVDVRHIRLTKSAVAFEEYSAGRDGVGSAINLLDLARARPKTVGIRGKDREAVAATDLELTDAGTIVWIWRVGTAEGTTYEVHKRAGTGLELLDDGPGIAPESLAVSDSVAYWMKDGVVRSSRLT